MKKILPIMSFAVVVVFMVFYMYGSSETSNEVDSKTLNQGPGSNKTTDRDAVDDNKNDANFEEAFKKILLALKDQEENRGLPKSMAEVKITPEVQSYLDKWPGGYDKLDYRLGLLDRLSSCLGEDAPKSGKVHVVFAFKVVDSVTKQAVGEFVNGKPFTVMRTTLSEEENKIVSDCLHTSHVGFPFDAFETLTKIGYPDEEEFTHPIEITFPIEDNGVYEFLANGSSSSP